MPHTNKKILIIDDETDLCLLLKDYFVRKNYEVIVSHTLSEGVNILNTERPKILFLDNNLPDGVGWDMAHVIATDFPDTYLVLISAFHSTIPKMPVGSQFRVIEKPISMSELNKQFSEL
jgi:DNA-binding response OmpR family regulator